MSADNTEERDVTAPRADSAQVQFALEQLRSQQNLLGAALAGVCASALGAAAWAGVTMATGYQIGWMAIGVGFLVGFAIRIVGKGLDGIYGVLGAVLSLLGCLAGNLFAVCGILAQQEGLPFLELVGGLDFAAAKQLMVATFSPMDLLFYAIAVYEGYKLSFREVTEQDLGAGVSVD
jgi:hypothetical protein